MGEHQLASLVACPLALALPSQLLQYCEQVSAISPLFLKKLHYVGLHVHVCTWELVLSEAWGIDSEVTGACESQCGYWELNSGLLQEQYSLWTAESSL